MPELINRNQTHALWQARVIPPLTEKKEWLIDETQLNGLLIGLDYTLLGKFEEFIYQHLF